VADRRGRRRDLATRESEERQAGLRIVTLLAGVPVGELGRVELAPQAQDLPLLVPGRADGIGIRATSRALRSGASLVDRLLPRALELHDLRAMHSTGYAERDHLGLGMAPRVERGGPLARAIDGVEALAAADHGAVDDPRHERTQLAAGRGQHRFIEERESGVVLAELRQRLPVEHAREAREIRIAEAVADLGAESAGIARLGRSFLAEERDVSARDEQVATLRAVARVLDQALRPPEPGGRAADLAHGEKAHSQPKRRTGRGTGIAGVGSEVVQALERGEVRVFVAGEDGGPREAFEILILERARALGVRERLECLLPGVARVCGATALERGRGIPGIGSGSGRAPCSSCHQVVSIDGPSRPWSERPYTIHESPPPVWMPGPQTF
jgi:hypothetical protein